MGFGIASGLELEICLVFLVPLRRIRSVLTDYAACGTRGRKNVISQMTDYVLRPVEDMVCQVGLSP
jgi:hypothetical protein